MDNWLVKKEINEEFFPSAIFSSALLWCSVHINTYAYIYGIRTYICLVVPLSLLFRLCQNFNVFVWVLLNAAAFCWCHSTIIDVVVVAYSLPINKCIIEFSSVMTRRRSFNLLNMFFVFVEDVGAQESAETKG